LLSFLEFIAKTFHFTAKFRHIAQQQRETRPVVFEAVAMSILLFYQMKLEKLEKELNSLKK
jgi:hypothetical protein